MLKISTQGDGRTGSVSTFAPASAAPGTPSLRLHRVHNSAQTIAQPACSGAVDAATRADMPGRRRACTTLIANRQPLPRPRQIEHMVSVGLLKQSIARLNQFHQQQNALIAEMRDLTRYLSERYLDAAAEPSAGADPLPQKAPVDTVAPEQAARSAQDAEQHQTGACCVIL